MFRMDPDGTITNLLGSPVQGYWWTIGISSANDKIIGSLQSNSDLTQFSLWMMSGGGIIVLDNIYPGSPVEGAFWSFSPDGSQAISLADISAGNDLVQVVQTDNSGYSIFSFPGIVGGNILWAPDGSNVFFPYDDLTGGNPGIGLGSPGSGSGRLISQDFTYTFEPFDWWPDSSAILASRTNVTTLATDVIKLLLDGTYTILFTDTTDRYWGNWPSAAISMDGSLMAFSGDLPPFAGGPHPIDMTDIGGTFPPTEFPVPSPGSSLNQIDWAYSLPDLVNPPPPVDTGILLDIV
jgi:hypothetical protein